MDEIQSLIQCHYENENPNVSNVKSGVYLNLLIFSIYNKERGTHSSKT